MGKEEGKERKKEGIQRTNWPNGLVLYVPVTLVPRRQAVLCELKASLIHIASSKLDRVTQ